jgi:hypothetical protein
VVCVVLEVKIGLLVRTGLVNIQFRERTDYLLVRDKVRLHSDHVRVDQVLGSDATDL